jgi:hemerythrin
MTLIKWREGYNTGVSQFDNEHHKIVELINVMYTAIRDKSGKEVTENACNEILAYTRYHFDNEEKAMLEVNYPGIEEQLAEHSRLKAEALRLQAMIGANFPEGASEFYRFLRHWLIKHIQDCDKKYGPYLQDTGKTG